MILNREHIFFKIGTSGVNLKIFISCTDSFYTEYIVAKPDNKGSFNIYEKKNQIYLKNKTGPKVQSSRYFDT